MHQPLAFGPELRRLRIAAGFTLSRLAASVHYSKGQLSKIENGHKRATVDFARMCDAVLEADGRLAALVSPKPGPRGTGTPLDQTGPDMRHHTRTASGRDRPREPEPPSRRHVMALGAASMLTVTPAPGAIPLASATPRPDTTGDVSLAAQDLFVQFRRMGQLSPPGTLLPVLAEQTRALSDLAAQCTDRTRSRLMYLAARHAEFAGWMAQESGSDGTAEEWTQHAVRLAQEAGDRELAGYAHTRSALINYYRGDAADTVAMASRALSASLPSRIRGLAAQHQAQGHALAGEYSACMRHLDRARSLLDTDQPGPEALRLGATHLEDPITMITGWCLLDLGRSREAAAVLDEACERLPAHAQRTRARYGVRRALAHARSGEVERACALARELLPAIRITDSATIRLDLRRLSRTLGRFRSVPAVSALSPDLTAVLHTSAH
ncbi:helix-turn-helix transcriptional regulator [Streptomyces sp. ME02-6978a]|nr:helix-turn-helix transcriptional regulator [Streptomyces sp. ME12-02E]MDX3333572.1 helix-turn-helix transcriptional regulator [Streptomyces sp. ME02-6978a]